MWECKSFCRGWRVAGAMENGGFDVVTSNPPYFAKGSAIPAEGAGKFRARHETTAVWMGSCRLLQRS